MRHTETTKHAVTWILVADGKQAQVYTKATIEHHVPMGGRGRRCPVEEVQVAELVPLLLRPLVAESADIYQMGRNQTGMVFESGSSARHMGEPHVDARIEVKQHFAQRIADLLNRAKMGDAFDQLVLVAPPKMLGEIKARLEPSIGAKVSATLAKELTHLDTRALTEHLAGIA
ncbi:MAG: host attachment protein [Rickettsiales bacterium]